LISTLMLAPPLPPFAGAQNELVSNMSLLSVGSFVGDGRNRRLGRRRLSTGASVAADAA
jgi:hypothetical protein